MNPTNHMPFLTFFSRKIFNSALGEPSAGSENGDQLGPKQPDSPLQLQPCLLLVRHR